MSGLEDEILALYNSLSDLLGDQTPTPDDGADRIDPSDRMTDKDAPSDLSASPASSDIAPLSFEIQQTSLNATIKLEAASEEAHVDIDGVDLQPVKMDSDPFHATEQVDAFEIDNPSANNIDVQAEREFAETPLVPAAEVYRDVAEVRTVEPDTAPAHELASDATPVEIFWHFMESEDIAGAYWVARSVEARGKQADSVPSWLIEALFGSHWMAHTNKLLAADLLEIAQHHKPDVNNQAQALLGLAAAIQPVIMAPYSGMLDWLEVPEGFDEIKNVIYHLKEFARHGVTLSSDDLEGVTDEQQLAETIKEISNETKTWLNITLSRRSNLKRAATVWRTLVNRGGGIYNLLQPVAENREQAYPDVVQQLSLWRNPQHYDLEINRIDGGIINVRSGPMVGAARNHIVRGIQEACDLAAQWSSLIERKNRLKSGNWISSQIDMMRHGIGEASPSALVLLDEMTLASQPSNIRVPAIYLRNALLHFHRQLGLRPMVNETAGVAQPPGWLIRNAMNISEVLNRRLLLLPELNFSEEQNVPQTQIGHLFDLLWQTFTERRTPIDAIEGWLKKQNYTFIEQLLPAIEDKTKADHLSEQAAKEQQGSIATLRANIYSVEEEVEQAVLDGILAEQDRTDFLANILAVQPEEVQNFQREYANLNSVRERLSDARNKRIKALNARRAEFEKTILTHETDESRRLRISEMLDRVFEQGDTRIIDETLAQLFENPHALLEHAGFERSTSDATVNDLEQYLLHIPQLANLLNSASSSRRSIKDIDILPMFAGSGSGRLPATRRQETETAIQAWERLKKSAPSHINAQRAIVNILNYLGFTMAGNSPVQTPQSGTDWLHVAVSMTDSGLARPIPQFGSLQHGKYDVVVLWDRPGADTIAARLRDLNLSSQSVIVFYMGRLTERQRRDVTRSNRDKKLTMALLDELLLLFLGRERDARLPTFLRCTLPFAELNPYTPTGDVPTEMFFGREDLVNALVAPMESCIVYGGRQLGKSALLRHVTRTFHNPEREQYAFVEDIKLLGVPTSGQTPIAIWSRLRETLKRLGLLNKRISTDKPEEIINHIRTAMMDVPNRRAIVMFDEADNFLDADAKDNFRVVEEFRKLMFETNRRFKVILTGLHNVQRFQALPNQPLAHFGIPINIGPLSPSDAQQLIRQPFETLGYRFAEQSVVLRIISYTNYHPALIQLFCQKLLEQLLKRTRLQQPPYEIRKQDVEAIYRDQKVRESMRERFDWTLALDMCYQAIAWGLIVEQSELKDSYACSYPPSQILEIVREWWPQGFQDSTIDRLRTLLDEMVGLGVLVREQNGHYRLRSPNLVRLMGSETDIGERLLELASKQPLEPFDADHHHAPIDDAGQQYSPLTYAQERQLNQNNSGVSLIFGSEALGITSLVPAFRNFIEGDYATQLEAVMEVPSHVKSLSEFRNWLQVMSSSSQVGKRIIPVRVSGSVLTNVTGFIEQAVEFCDSSRSRSKWLRIIFIFDSKATWQWLLLPLHIRQKLETQAQSMLFLKRWSHIGIQQRLMHHQKMHAQEISDFVEEKTGGWHTFLDELFVQAPSNDDMRPIALSVFNALRQEDGSLSVAAARKLGIDISEAVTKVLNTLLNDLQAVPADLLVPDLIDSGEHLTVDECNAAVEYLQRMGCVSLLHAPASEHSSGRTKQQLNYAVLSFLRRSESIA
jgi:hypothetical protein